MVTVTTENWSHKIRGNTTEFSVSKTRTIAIVGITQARGFGSIFDASSDGVICLVGVRRDGLEEAFARSLTSVLGSERVILTLALRDSGPETFKDLLVELKKLQ